MLQGLTVAAIFVPGSNPVVLILLGGALIAVSVWLLRRGSFPGGFRISWSREGYEGPPGDRQDPRSGVLVVTFWLVCGVLCVVSGVWALV